MGTPYYVAPEILTGEQDCKSDVWSAGVILYMMITGRPPFNGYDDKEVVKKIKFQKPNFNIQEFEDISPECIDLLKGLLERNPSLRLNANDALDHTWIKRNYKKSMGVSKNMHKALINM